MTEFFQIARMLTQELRQEGQAMLTKMAEVEQEPPFLSSNGLYEGSTRCWRSLMIILSARSWWAEQAANCLLKACAIAYELEWGFFSKAIEMFGLGMTGEGDGHVEVIRPKDGEGGLCRIREEMSSQMGDIWRGGLALGGEASREILLRNSKLRTVDH